MKTITIIASLLAAATLSACGTRVIEPPKKDISATQPAGDSQLQGKIAAYTSRVQEGLDEREKGVALSQLPKARELTSTTTFPATAPASQPAARESSPQIKPQEKAPAPAVENKPAETPSAARPVAATRPATVQDLLPLLRERAAAQPQNLSLAMSLKLLEESIMPIPAPNASGAAPATQPFVPYMVPQPQDERLLNDLAAILRNTPAQSTQNMATRTAPLLDLAKTYAAEGDLKIPVLALTSRVDSFGVYQPMEGRLPAGRRTPAVLYCEVSNFLSTKSDDGYTTKLAHQDTLLTSDGMLVWRSNPEQIVDTCRNARQDFYLVKRINFPEALPVGSYVLKLTVTDQQSNKIASASINITVGQ